jgi:transketolase
MPDARKNPDQLAVNTIRMLAVDMVERANSGHPGLPLGAAPMIYVLWSRFLRHNPEDPGWPDRDRFVLSAGHGSALLYAMLHLFGYDLPLEELKRFRQWGSRTPGHPEYGLTAGVEATTGPLGQGFAMGVGMALAERFLAESFNRPEMTLVDHHTYALVSDGDLMEGVSSEAASLAGTLGLGKLIYLYDDNKVSIEGHTDLAFTEDVSRRFQAYGWQVIRVADGNDLDSIEKAVSNAQAKIDQPTLIMVRTSIGYGSPKQDSEKAHGEPLGSDALRATKEYFGWPLEPDFHVPDDVREHVAGFVSKVGESFLEWQAVQDAYRHGFPDEARRFERQMQNRLPAGWDENLPAFTPADGSMATRSASGKVLNALASVVSNLIGGSADLAPSTKTLLERFPDFGSRQHGARNIRFGVREHGMAGIVNGMALHGGVIPYGATFLVFSDYMRPAIRLAALMNSRSIFVFTHDSIGVGEDGPTHQPVEHLASLRAIPNLTVIRPADANETVAAWKVSLTNTGPTALVLTRQTLPILDPGQYAACAGAMRGAYVLGRQDESPDLIIIASGSEVHPALRAAEVLEKEGYKVRVVSMPSWEMFRRQPESYRDAVLPPAVESRLAVEAGRTLGWREWVGLRGDVIGLDEFGSSAPGDELMDRMGFNVENIAARARALLNR